MEQKAGVDSVESGDEKDPLSRGVPRFQRD